MGYLKVTVGCLLRGRRYGGSIGALVQTLGKSAPNFGIGKVLCLLIEFLCLGKVTAAKAKLAKCEVHAVIQVIMATHSLTAVS